MMQCRRVRSDVSTSFQQSSILNAAGTSVAACLPAFIAARHTGTCHCHGVAVYTMSMSSRSTRRSNACSSPVKRASSSVRPASRICFTARSNFSGAVSQIAVMRTFSTASSSCSTERPRNPVPTMATRTSSCFANGTPTIEAALRSGCESVIGVSRAGPDALAVAGRPSAMPAPASAAPFSRSRREGSFGESVITAHLSEVDQRSEASSDQVTAAGPAAVVKNIARAAASGNRCRYDSDQSR